MTLGKGAGVYNKLAGSKKVGEMRRAESKTPRTRSEG
jgi:hypothetical protein